MVLTFPHPPREVFLKIVFEAEWHRGRPLSETIPLVERIRKALPAVDKIWAYNPFGRLKEHMRELAIWEERAFAGLLEDRFTMETPSVPPTLTCHRIQRS